MGYQNASERAVELKERARVIFALLDILYMSEMTARGLQMNPADPAIEEKCRADFDRIKAKATDAAANLVSTAALIKLVVAQAYKNLFPDGGAIEAP